MSGVSVSVRLRLLLQLTRRVICFLCGSVKTSVSVHRDTCRPSYTVRGAPGDNDERHRRQETRAQGCGGGCRTYVYTALHFECLCLHLLRVCGMMNVHYLYIFINILDDDAVWVTLARTVCVTVALREREGGRE